MLSFLIDERSRLRELESFEIMDSERESEYDDLTRLAAYICDTKYALITILDDDRQWLKSVYGLEGITECPRSISFCHHTIQTEEGYLIVNDTSKDERFRANPLVLDYPNLGFYVGISLVTPIGARLGSLCVLDDKANEINDAQFEALRGLANQVMKLLELRRNNIELSKMLESLNSKNHQLEQFTYITSHDLQEPLRTINNLTSFISKKYSAGFDVQGKQALQYIDESSSRMSHMIRELLQYSRIGRSGSSESVNLNELISEIVSDLDLKIKESFAEIRYNELPTILGNRSDIRSLFQNLIENALKYRHPGVEPKIEISVDNEKQHWKFTISDNGIGISPEHHERIFEIFQRLHLKNEYSGTGIGLAHCRKIVDQYSGKIWVESNGMNGSNFYFTLLSDNEKI